MNEEIRVITRIFLKSSLAFVLIVFILFYNPLEVYFQIPTKNDVVFFQPKKTSISNINDRLLKEKKINYSIHKKEEYIHKNKKTKINQKYNYHLLLL
jgi:hypothetical protein